MFSYTLFLALLLLSPGLAVWAGFRAGDRNHLLSQAPERPQSTFSLLVIVFGALTGHFIMACIYAAQALWCKATNFCATVSFDTNVYRIILHNHKGDWASSDIGLLWWLLALLLPSVFAGSAAYYISKIKAVRNFRETATLGWLKRVIDRKPPESGFILAYVVTSIEANSSYVAYEGIVENIALDDNRAITMLVLSSCDRFLVKMTQTALTRVDSKRPQKSIPLLQIEAKNIKNVALEVFAVTPPMPPSKK